MTGHEGPVWQVSWAHPKFGVILASCSYDGRVLIWREENNQWSIINEHNVHSASVNSISWAPSEYGAMLLCTSSDGTASIIEFLSNGNTKTFSFDAHSIGVNAGTWAPCVGDGMKFEDRKIVTGGCDNLVKIWKFSNNGESVLLDEVLQGHTDWVRDVSWSPTNLGKSYVATASQDRTVIIWTKENNDNKWKKKLLSNDKFPDVCWRASWSLSGNILAISGNDKVTLWKENLNGDWESAGEIDQ